MQYCNLHSMCSKNATKLPLSGKKILANAENMKICKLDINSMLCFLFPMLTLKIFHILTCAI